ncbi:glycerate kinase [Blastococcus sp. VKM Ac-2987]|uniref:glycerate kinase n=1 Tax=Blastococcus sp. VKM Ac-2987 TaxID=3004141 RepID=UPI0022AB5C7F|nr:glycerate kinase [Blastococcus sp. VKM Ac-2987]MCZ2856936.1 glycerate kinase [Blastococcus sp. VKM Ac-2987]
MKVLIAPDSFKGTLPATEAAACIAAGWRSARPEDSITLLPLADGGEGTLEAIAAADRRSEWIDVPAVTGPCGAAVTAQYLMTGDGTAVIELARSSGLPLASRLDPLGATTRGVGEVVLAALRRGATEIVVAVGGSASTDGGAGLLAALGLRLLGARGDELPDGGAALARVAGLDRSQLVAPPPGGVTVLTDVRNPLLGPAGAAAVFGPQKGATPEQIRLLDEALTRWAAICGGDPEQPGAGAAGGTAFGLQALWGASLSSGAVHVARLAGLHAALDSSADLVLTGEGRFDGTSLGGKVCGHVIEQARSRRLPVGVVCGQQDASLEVPGVRAVSLSELAGSAREAMADPSRWAEEAGAHAARTWAR